MKQYITGAVHTYHRTKEDIDLGVPPEMRDELYASSNNDGTSWNVYRVSAETPFPATIRDMPLLRHVMKACAAVGLAIAPSPIERTKIFRDLLSAREAFELVREHDISPPAVPGLIYKSHLRAEDAATYWRAVPEPARVR